MLYDRIKIGGHFGRWEVLDFKFKKSKKNKNLRFCLCKCVCGRVKLVGSYELLNGESKSCGCLHKEVVGKINYKHGLFINRKIPREYDVYKQMRQRCYNKNHISYKNYGARGIKVCDRWKESFLNFLEDMGPRPGDTYSLERKDNNIDYTPGNCIWILRKNQNKNKRNSLIVYYNKKKYALVDLAKELNIGYCRLRKNLIKHKYSVEKTVGLLKNNKSQIGNVHIKYLGKFYSLAELERIFGVPKAWMHYRVSIKHMGIYQIIREIIIKRHYGKI